MWMGRRDSDIAPTAGRRQILAEILPPGRRVIFLRGREGTPSPPLHADDGSPWWERALPACRLCHVGEPPAAPRHLAQSRSWLLPGAPGGDPARPGQPRLRDGWARGADSHRGLARGAPGAGHSVRLRVHLPGPRAPRLSRDHAGSPSLSRLARGAPELRHRGHLRLRAGLRLLLPLRHPAARAPAPRSIQRLVPGQLTSPYFVLGRQQPSTYTHVRLGLLPPSGLVWLVIWPGTLGSRVSSGQYSSESH